MVPCSSNCFTCTDGPILLWLTMKSQPSSPGAGDQKQFEMGTGTGVTVPISNLFPPPQTESGVTNSHCHTLSQTVTLSHTLHLSQCHCHAMSHSATLSHSAMLSQSVTLFYALSHTVILYHFFALKYLKS